MGILSYRAAGFDLKDEALDLKDGLLWREVVREFLRSRGEI
jgi:hypothetical protein